MKKVILSALGVFSKGLPNLLPNDHVFWWGFSAEGTLIINLRRNGECFQTSNEKCFVCFGSDHDFRTWLKAFDIQAILES